jgi:hypothetical protein
MRISNTGNVGIGTTNPGEKLEVNGTILSKTSGAPSIIKQSNGVRNWQYIADNSPDFLGIHDGTDYRLIFEGTGILILCLVQEHR